MIKFQSGPLRVGEVSLGAAPGSFAPVESKIYRSCTVAPCGLAAGPTWVGIPSPPSPAVSFALLSGFGLSHRL